MVSRSGPLAALAVLGAMSVCVEGFRSTARDGPASSLRMVRVVAPIADGVTSVILEADGPLPEATGGALDGPPRIYLDLKGVMSGPDIRMEGPRLLVLGTRVARRSASPLVTRVVIDLQKMVPYRVDASGQEQGRLVVILGNSPASPLAASVSVRPKRPPSGPASTASSASSAVDGYGARVSGALSRLQALRPLLVSIDRRDAEPPGDLEAAAAELDAIGRLLAAIKPPASRETTHGLLLRACALGARASRVHKESIRTTDALQAWNAASAAAGALMMLDRASIDLGPVLLDPRLQDW